MDRADNNFRGISDQSELGANFVQEQKPKYPSQLKNVDIAATLPKTNGPVVRDKPIKLSLFSMLTAPIKALAKKIMELCFFPKKEMKSDADKLNEHALQDVIRVDPTKINALQRARENAAARRREQKGEAVQEQPPKVDNNPVSAQARPNIRVVKRNIAAKGEAVQEQPPKVDSKPVSAQARPNIRVVNRNIAVKSEAVQEKQQPQVNSRPKVAGIRNGTNCCYINVVSQFILHDPGIRDILQNHPQYGSEFKKLSENYDKCAADGKSVDPEQFINLLRKIAPNAVGQKGAQGDTANILFGLFEALRNTGKTDRSIRAASPNESLDMVYDRTASAPNRKLPGPESKLNIAIPSPVQWPRPIPGNPLNLTISSESFLSGNDGKDANYNCNYFVYWVGDTSSGHYMCCKKIDNQWCKVDDDKVSPISSQEAERLAKNHGTFFNYSATA